MPSRRALLLSAAAAACNPWRRASAASGRSASAAADRLFRAGKFAAAGEIYRRIAAQNSKAYPAALQLGRIALLSDRLGDAQKWLQRAIVLRPGDTDARVMLAETFYRRDDFENAAAALDGIDTSGNKLILSQYPTLNVAKLRSFKGETPYELHGSGESTRLKFLRTNPLPLVKVRVNGGDDVVFFIDTGGSEVALDTDFARELDVSSGQVEALPPALLFVDTGLAGAGVKLARSVIEKAGIRLEEEKAYEGIGGAGKLKIVPYVVRKLSFGSVRQDDVPGLYDGPFPWEYTYGFHLAGMVGDGFFKSYAVTFDFKNMQIYLQ